MSPGLFAALVAAGIALFGAAVLSLIYLYVQSRETAQLRRRMDPGGGRGGEFAESGGGDVMQTLATQGKKLEALVDTENEAARLLVQAGWRSARQRLLYYASQFLMPFVMLIPIAFLWLFGPEKLTQPQLMVLWSLGAVMLGLLLPKLYLRSVAAGRVRKMKAEVPMFIHLLVLLFESGLSTRQAFASLVREGSGVLPQLGSEFERLLRQLEAGGETGELLDNLAKSIDLEDLTNVLALLRQVDRYGGEVREPLLETLQVIEERRTLDMRELVNLMSGRMTVVMVLFFFPALLIFVAGPAFVSIIKGLGSVNG